MGRPHPMGARLNPPRYPPSPTAARLRVRITLVVHEHKPIGRGIDLATLTEELKERHANGPAPVAG